MIHTNAAFTRVKLQLPMAAPCSGASLIGFVGGTFASQEFFG
jgi:hypothetical protein